MSGDYTRYTFRREKRFTAVRLQQGRVQMDADWNESVDIANHRERVALNDVIGPTGMPEDAPGFSLTPVQVGDHIDLVIGAGRAYVKGVLVEHEQAEETTLQKVSGEGAETIWEVSSGPRLLIDQWIGPAANPLSNPVPVTEIVEPDGESEDRQRVKLAEDIGSGTKTVVGLASYGTQPHLPDLPKEVADGFYLAYLHVWEREITALEDESLRDVALGGPDTAVRTQVVWQVKLLTLKDLIDEGEVADPPTCKVFGADWTPDGNVGGMTLAARTNPAEETPDPCALPSTGGYRSLENRLYRVQIHAGAAPDDDSVLVKWSRDNGIHRSRLLDVEDGSLVVEEIGKDDATAFKPGEFLEVLDEGRILRGEPGFFVELSEVVDTRLGISAVYDPETVEPITDNGEPDTDVLPKLGLVRRWEGGLPVEAQRGEWLALENGVEIQIGEGRARTCDHWLIAARTLTASIEWPADEGSGEAAFQPPVGIAHRFCALAILEFKTEGWTVVNDCRPIFPPLTRLESFFYLGGDGQEGMPDLSGDGEGEGVLLGAPLRVGVARGKTPVQGRLVRFRVTDPEAERGQLSPATGTAPEDIVRDTGDELIVRTGDDGVAQAALALDRRRHYHHVVAELLDAIAPEQADPIHLPIHFTANTSVASEVGYDPDNCPYQAEAGIAPGTSTTVQSAIDKLCPRVELVLLGGDGQELCVNMVAPAKLTVGLFWGKEALSDVQVSFEVLKGSATVTRDKVRTEQGIAWTELKAGDEPLEKNNGVVVVEAKVADARFQAFPRSLTFTARFVNAQCIYVDGNVCPEGQAQSGNTVSGLIGYLCSRTSGGNQDPGIHVHRVLYSNIQGVVKPLPLHGQVVPSELNLIIFVLDTPVDSKVFLQGHVGEIVIDLPFPDTSSGVLAWWLANQSMSQSQFGFRSTKLRGRFSLPDPQTIIWTPDDVVKRWLTEKLLNALAQMGLAKVQARAVLFGNTIWAQNDSSILLDGDLFANPNDRETGISYPTGDGRRGGDLVLPFYLGQAGAVPVPGGSNFIGFVPVINAGFFTGFTADDVSNLGIALDAGLDRKTVDAAKVVPEEVPFDTSRSPDTATAKDRMRRLRLTTNSLRVLVHKDHAALFNAMKGSLTEATGLQLEAVATTSTTPADGIINRLKRDDPEVDVVLVDASIFKALSENESTSDKVGATLFTL